MLDKQLSTHTKTFRINAQTEIFLAFWSSVASQLLLFFFKKLQIVVSLKRCNDLFMDPCSVLDCLNASSIISSVPSPGGIKPGTNPERVLLRNRYYVSLITLNGCFINSDVLRKNQITVKTYDICPLLRSPARHTSQVSLCHTGSSSRPVNAQESSDQPSLDR